MKEPLAIDKNTKLSEKLKLNNSGLIACCTAGRRYLYSLLTIDLYILTHNG